MGFVSFFVPGVVRRDWSSSSVDTKIGVMQDSATSTASELGALLGRGGKETDPHGVSSILWTHLVREPRRKTIRAQKKESDGGHLERSEALARRKVSFLQRQGDTDLHASVRSKAVTDACVTELGQHKKSKCAVVCTLRAARRTVRLSGGSGESGLSAAAGVCALSPV